MITRPVRERIDHRHRRDGRRAWPATGFEEVGLLSLSSADHSEIGELAKGLADRYEGTNTGAVAAVDPRRRVQHRPGQRAVPQRASLWPDVRARGRQRADPPGDQQDGQSEEDLIRTVTAAYGRRLAPGEALLHVRAADRDRRGRAADRRAGAQRHQGRPRGERARATSAARCRSAGSCPSRTPRSSGPRSSAPRRPTRGCASCATPSAPTGTTGGRSASATTTASPASSRACSRAATAGSAGSSERVWRDGGRFDGWSEHFSFDRWMAAAERALADEPVDVDWYTTRERERERGPALGPPGLRASTRTGSGRTGRTRWPRTRSRTAAGRRASTAASARRWAPRSRSARPAARCCR